MEERIRLEVLGISYSQIQSGAYALILAQTDGPIRIPIVIGAAEAQSIAIRMEGIKPPRPLTHDLFTTFAHAFGVKLLEVYIYRFENGIFSSELTFSDGERQIVIDSRTSDAIAIAMRTGSPIYTTRAILEETGFVMEIQPDPTNRMPSQETLTPPDPQPENHSIEELEKMLSKLIDQERYEDAAKVSEILKRKKEEASDRDA